MNRQLNSTATVSDATDAMPLTELQQVLAAKKEAASKLPLSTWLDNRWSELYEATHLANLLVMDLEFQLDAGRAVRSDNETVTLNFRRSKIDRTIWLASKVADVLADLDDLLVTRINRLAVDEVHHG
jgi:hypothetical protein